MESEESLVREATSSGSNLDSNVDSSKIKRISTGYAPRPLQRIIHQNMKRFNVLVLHRRFGKTVLSINETIDRALRCPLKSPQYAYVAPTYGQAKRIAWEYLKEYTKEIPGAKPNEAELRVDIPRPHMKDKIRFMLLGSENPDTLRGIYLDGVVLDEFAVCDPTIWGQVVRPALADRIGWAIFLGTPKGQNHFFDLYNKARKNPDWYVCTYRASETKVLSTYELRAAKDEMSEEEYLQEFECSFTAANTGAYYQKQMLIAEAENRVTSVPYDSSCFVDTYWDLGIGDTTAIWFLQVVGHEYHLIDYLEMSGKGLDYFVSEINKKPYTYREHTLPHDARARELGTGKSREETLRTLGMTRLYILPRWQVADGINAVRTILSKCWWDKDKCERGLLALHAYERKWDAKNQIFQEKPKHNWASNGADAFRYLAMGVRPESQRVQSEVLREYRDSYQEYDVFSL